MRFQKNPQVEVAPMNDESVLFNPNNNKFCTLNRTATFIWDQLAQPRSPEELAALVGDAFQGVTSDRALGDVQTAMENFLAVDCVVRVEQ